MFHQYRLKVAVNSHGIRATNLIECFNLFLIHHIGNFTSIASSCFSLSQGVSFNSLGQYLAVTAHRYTKHSIKCLQKIAQSTAVQFNACNFCIFNFKFRLSRFPVSLDRSKFYVWNVRDIAESEKNAQTLQKIAHPNKLDNFINFCGFTITRTIFAFQS
jgi:hypothetical protein